MRQDVTLMRGAQYQLPLTPAMAEALSHRFPTAGCAIGVPFFGHNSVADTTMPVVRDAHRPRGIRVSGAA